jgi:hypothetical protein
MTQRIREAMEDNGLSMFVGTISDETWVGGKPANRHVWELLERKQGLLAQRGGVEVDRLAGHEPLSEGHMLANGAAEVQPAGGTPSHPLRLVPRSVPHTAMTSSAKAMPSSSVGKIRERGEEPPAPLQRLQAPEGYQKNPEDKSARRRPASSAQSNG